MAIELAAWNAQEGLALTKDYQAQHIVQTVRDLKHDGKPIDAWVLSDAYWLGNPKHGASESVADTSLNALIDEGYELTQVEYGDDEYRPARYLAILSRIPVNQAVRLDLAGRSGLEVSLTDPDSNVDIKLVGAHLSDVSEEKRLDQVGAFLGQVDLSEPTVLAGDLNSMPASSLRAAILRLGVIRGLSGLAVRRGGSLAESASLVQRLNGMANGATLEQLKRAGLYNTNLSQSPTKLARHYPVFQLDHILRTEHLGASGFQVHQLPKTKPSISDHLPVSVTIES